MFIKFCAAALMATALVSCGHNEQKEKTAEMPMPMKQDSMPAAKTADLGNIVLGIDKDLVCGMPTKGHTEDTTTYKGKVYGFCSKECKDEFVKNPESFLAQK